MQPACKLCRAIADSGGLTAAQRELPGSDVFTRDRDVCDACLAQDYAGRWYADIFALFSLGMGSIIAFFLASSLVLWGFTPVLSSLILSFITVWAVGTLAIALAMWLTFKAMIWWSGTRKTPAPSVSPTDAERLYWVAVWAALTGRHRFKRRVLRKARQCGFTDRVRLADARLGNG